MQFVFFAAAALICFVTPSASVVLPRGVGGQLSAPDKHLIITIAAGHIAVISDRMNEKKTNVLTTCTITHMTVTIRFKCFGTKPTFFFSF